MDDYDYDVNGGYDYGASHGGAASSPLAAGVAAATLLDQSSASLGAANPWASGDYSAEVAEVDAEVKRATEDLTGAIGELAAFR